MIFIRPNGHVFYCNTHPCGVDVPTVPKTPSCRAANSACCGRSPRAVLPVKTQEATSMFDSKAVIEKTPLHRHESSEKTMISLDVSGFQPEHLKVEIDDHVLMVSGQRTNKLGDTFVTRRRFALKTDIYDEDSVHADLEDGVLEITIQKKMVPKSRHIPITVTLSNTPFTTNEKNSNDAGATRSTATTSEVEIAVADAVPTTINEQNSHSEETNSTETAAPLEQSESGDVVSVETVDEEERGEEAEVEEGEAPSAPQTPYEDTWEEVVQA
jgi:HSP20 family molecular chaperone IbpA